MKKLLSVTLCCALIFGVCGCSVPATLPTPEPDISAIDSSKYQDVYGDYLLYQQLSATEKVYYGMIYTTVQDNLAVETTIQGEDGQQLSGIRIPLTGAQLSAEETTRLFESFYLDNPALFFIDRTYSLAGQQIGDKNVYDTLILQYTMTAEQRVTAVKELDYAIDKLLQNCPVSKDDYTKELYLHDALLSSCVYDQSATESAAKHPNAYSAYGALVQGKAVCEGYAKAMQILLNKVSIPTTVVRGFSSENQTGHMWNLAKINGEYYYLDPTWDDSEPQHHYSYFNITSEALKRTHIIDTATPLTITCTSETDNYYIRNDAYITDYERDDIADAIAKQIQLGNTTVHLRFANGKYENGLLFLKNATLTKKMVNARLSDGLSMWDYELRLRADQNTISLHKI